MSLAAAVAIALLTWALAYFVVSRRSKSPSVYFYALSGVSVIAAAILTDNFDLRESAYLFVVATPMALTAFVTIRAALRRRAASGTISRLE